LFLETQGGVLDSINIQTEKIDPTNTQKITITPKKVEDTDDIDIFNTVVYRDSPSEHIKKVQKILRDIHIYKGGLTGDYADIEDDIVAYQLARDIIAASTDTGA
jgi:hypothetical protein